MWPNLFLLLYFQTVCSRYNYCTHFQVRVWPKNCKRQVIFLKMKKKRGLGGNSLIRLVVYICCPETKWTLNTIPCRYHIKIKTDAEKTLLDLSVCLGNSRALPDITFDLEVRQIFKIWTVQKPNVFLPECRTFKNRRKIKKNQKKNFSKHFSQDFFVHLLLTPNLCPGTLSYENW